MTPRLVPTLRLSPNGPTLRIQSSKFKPPFTRVSRFTSLRLPRNARQAVVESIHSHRHARNRHRTQPASTAKTRRHRRVVLRPRDGGVVVDLRCFHLGCTLSRYLWEINTMVTSVVLGTTSLGITFCVFILIAGTASERCPYRTPGSLARPSLSDAKDSDHTSFSCRGQSCRSPCEKCSIRLFLEDTILKIPLAFAVDAYRLGQGLSWAGHFSYSSAR